MRMIWKFGSDAAFSDSNYAGAPRKIWKLGNELSNTMIREFYSTQKKAEMSHARYSILTNFPDPLDVCSYKKEETKIS